MRPRLTASSRPALRLSAVSDDALAQRVAQRGELRAHGLLARRRRLRAAARLAAALRRGGALLGGRRALGRGGSCACRAPSRQAWPPRAWRPACGRARRRRARRRARRLRLRHGASLGHGQTRRTLVPGARACLPPAAGRRAGGIRGRARRARAGRRGGAPRRRWRGRRAGARARRRARPRCAWPASRCRAHRRIEVGLGAAPEGADEAVAAVPRDRHDLRLGVAARPPGRRATGSRPRPGAASSGKYSGPSHMRPTQVGSHEKTTTRSRATRRSSAGPRAQSLQWCSGEERPSRRRSCASAKGSASALACTAGAAPGGRWAIITADGSTAVTSRSGGS